MHRIHIWAMIAFYWSTICSITLPVLKLFRMEIGSFTPFHQKMNLKNESSGRKEKPVNLPRQGNWWNVGYVRRMTKIRTWNLPVHALAA